MEDIQQHLVKRHGTALHVEAANIFTGIVLLLLVLYSLSEVLSARYRSLSKLTRYFKSPILLTIVWILLCAWAIFHHFKSDILQIARRYGQLAIATSTISVFLAMKPAILPYTYQVGLVTVHKWVGRTSVLCAAVHGITYFISYATRKSEAKEAAHDKRHAGHEHKLFSLFNIFGMICLLAYFIILSSSFGKVRRRVYYIFYGLHRPLVILIYVLMIWHARPSSWLLVPTGLIMLAIQVAIRVILHKPIQITGVKKFGPTLSLVSFEPPIPQSLVRSSASHIRLTAPFTNPTVFFKSSHPYTLIGSNQLIVRESRSKIIEESLHSMYGPFSSSFDPEPYTHLLVFAGGSGVSMLPSLNKVVPNQRLIWVTRSAQEIPIISELDLLNCEVYISASSPRTTGNYTSVEADDYELEEFEIDSDHESNVIDEEQTDLGSAEEPNGDSAKNHQRRYGRPDFDKIVDSFFFESDDPNAKICVVSCGPQELVNAATQWAGKRGYDSWSEVYAL